VKWVASSDNAVQIATFSS